MGYLKRWFWENRFRRNIVLSFVAWVMMQQLVFHLLVYKGDMPSPAAKALLSPLGAPLGVLIQWAVFGDRVRSLWRASGWRRTIFGGGRKYAAAKIGLFFLNQALYALFFYEAGLSPGRANTAAAPIGSLASYALLMWVTGLKNSDEEAETVE
jgi:hypothetical protein